MVAFSGQLTKYQLFKQNLLDVSYKRDHISVCLSYSSQSLLVLAGHSLKVVCVRIIVAYLKRLRRELSDKVGSNACRDQQMSLTSLRKYEDPHQYPPPPQRHTLYRYKIMLIFFCSCWRGRLGGIAGVVVGCKNGD
jgi:hypothetical protein